MGSGSTKYLGDIPYIWYHTHNHYSPKIFKSTSHISTMSYEMFIVTILDNIDHVLKRPQCIISQCIFFIHRLAPFDTYRMLRMCHRKPGRGHWQGRMTPYCLNYIIYPKKIWTLFCFCLVMVIFMLWLYIQILLYHFYLWFIWPYSSGLHHCSWSPNDVFQNSIYKMSVLACTWHHLNYGEMI